MCKTVMDLRNDTGRGVNYGGRCGNKSPWV